MSIYIYYSHDNCSGYLVLYSDGNTYWTEAMIPSSGYSLKNNKLRLYKLKEYKYEYIGEL